MKPIALLGEYDAYASTLFISTLACSPVGREMELRFVPRARSRPDQPHPLVLGFLRGLLGTP